MADADINIRINAINNTRRAFADFGQILTGFNSALAIARQAIELFKKAYEFSEEGAQLARLEDASYSMARSVGLDMEEIVKAVRTASKGMVADTDIMASATKALMLGVGDSAEDMATLMEIAAVRGRAMGVETTKAFEDIVTGIGRQSKKILDNLGIVIDTQQAYRDYADSLGKASSQLTENEKKEAILQAVIEDTRDLLKETGGVIVDNAAKFDQLKAAEKNYYDTIKKSSAGWFSAWNEFWAESYNNNILIEQWRDLKKEAKELGVAFGDLEGFNFTGGVTDADLAAESIETLKTRVDEAIPSLGLMNDAVQVQALLLGELTEATYDLEAAQSQMKTTAGFVREAFKEQGLELSNNKWLMDQIALATGEMTVEEMAQRDAINVLTAAYADQTITQSEYLAALLATNQAMLEGEAMAFALAAALGSLPREIRTKILIEQFGYQTGNWTGGNIYGPVTPPGQPKMEAEGGPVTMNNPYIVGEQGPELFVPQGSGTIIPNNKLGGGGNITVVINTPVNLADETWVERKLYPYIKRGLKEAVRGA